MYYGRHIFEAYFQTILLANMFKAKKEKSSLKHQESAGSIGIEKIITRMEDGMTMSRFYPSGKRKPENRVYHVNVQRMLLYWTRPDRTVEDSGIVLQNPLLRSKVNDCFNAISVGQSVARVSLLYHYSLATLIV